MKISTITRRVLSELIDRNEENKTFCFRWVFSTFTLRITTQMSTMSMNPGPSNRDQGRSSKNVRDKGEKICPQSKRRIRRNHKIKGIGTTSCPIWTKAPITNQPIRWTQWQVWISCVDGGTCWVGFLSSLVHYSWWQGLKPGLLRPRDQCVVVFFLLIDKFPIIFLFSCSMGHESFFQARGRVVMRLRSLTRWI